MAIQVINVGSRANGGGGDPLRTAMIKINDNFQDLYPRVQALEDGTIVSDIVANDSTILVSSTFGYVNADVLQGTIPTGVMTWENIGGTPDSLGEYGILDAYTKAQVDQLIDIAVDQMSDGTTDFKGSFFADDSTLIIDGVAGTVNAGALTGALPAIDGSALTGITVSALDGDMTGSVFGDNSTLLVDGVNSTIPAANLTGALPALDGSALTGVTATANSLVGDMTGSVFADDSTLLVDGVNGTLNSSALTKPIALGDNEKITFGDDDDLEIHHTGGVNYIAGAGGTILTGNWLYLRKPGSAENYLICKADGAVEVYYDNVKKLETTTDGISVTGKITGLTDPTAAQDAATKAYVDTNAQAALVSGTNIKTVNGESLLGSGNITISGGSGGGSAFTNIGVGADDSTIRSISEGESFLILGGTGLTTTSDAEGNITIDFSGGALTGSSLEPTSVGTGDGNDLTLTGGDATELNSTGGDTNITGGSGALASGNVNIGTTQTGAVAIGASGVGTSIGGTLTANGNAIFNTGVQEAFDTLTSSTGTVTHDCDNGHVFYHTGATGDITANFTNLGLTAEYGTNLTVIINQGATPYEVTAVQIGGVAQTINWQGGSAPTGNANGIDSFSFTILRDGSSYVVLGQMVDFT